MGSAFSASAPMVAPPPSGSRGSLAHTLHIQGGGVWAQTPQGLRWCGAKSTTASPFDITKACLAAVLPDGMDKDLYCSKGGQCPHKLGYGYKSLIKEMLPHPSELITPKQPKAKKEPEEATEEKPNKKSKSSKGSKGGRGGGRGGRGTSKKE